MMPTSGSPRTYPALAVLTIALVATMAVAGGGLLLALNAVFAAQIDSGAKAAAQRQFDTLKEPFSQMLWDYNRTQAQAVASAVARSPEILGLTLLSDLGDPVFQESLPGPSFLTLSAPLTYQAQPVGSLTIRFSLAAVDGPRAAVQGFSVVIFLTFLVLLGVLVPFLLNRTVLRRFTGLAGSLGHDPVTGVFPDLPEPNSRIREIRQMEEALWTLNRAVVRQVEELEARVKARTQDLEAAQAAMIHSETMATLGQLAAGIAHELNTPLAAVLSTARYLQGRWEEVLIPLLARSLEVPGAAEPGVFLAEAGRLAADLDLSPASSVQRKLRTRWASLGRKPGTGLADMVTETGLATRFEELVLWSEDHPANATVELVAAWSRSLAILITAAEKGAGVVSALRSQVHNPLVREPRPMELRQEIERALILVQNRTRTGITVRVEATEDIWVLGEPEELGKVWLNILVNGIQAMDGQGNLWITIRAEDPWAIAEFHNDGPPIPEALITRIFEPFFTTKGAGMGLGLAITQTVITENQGKLEVESVPGRTTFRVFLTRLFRTATD